MNADHGASSLVAPARLVIVDDHELARAGLRSILAGASDLNVVGEAGSAAEAVALCGRLKPNLVLLDIRMPDRDGIDTIPAIRSVCPDARIVIVTIHEDADYVLRAVRAGATGYLLKDASSREILDTVRRVLHGEVRLHPAAAFRVVQHLAERRGATTGVGEGLTRRELEVLARLSEGRTNPEIAADLGIGTGTVKIHVERILAKLGVGHRAQAAVLAIQLGLVPSTGEASGPLGPE